MLKTLFRITTKRVLRVRLIIILRSVSNVFNVWKIKNKKFQVLELLKTLFKINGKCILKNVSNRNTSKCSVFEKCSKTNSKYIW